MAEEVSRLMMATTKTTEEILGTMECREDKIENCRADAKEVSNFQADAFSSL